jgi:hypothetical protein
LFHHNHIHDNDFGCKCSCGYIAHSIRKTDKYNPFNDLKSNGTPLMREPVSKRKVYIIMRTLNFMRVEVLASYTSKELALSDLPRIKRLDEQEYKHNDYYAYFSIDKVDHYEQYE